MCSWPDPKQSSCAAGLTQSKVPLNSIYFHARLEVQGQLLNQDSKATIRTYPELHNYRKRKKKKNESITFNKINYK